MNTSLWVCGVDEAGRGPLAGPVYAAAVILDDKHPIIGLADSKKLSESKRNHLAGEIRLHAVAWSIATATAKEIDEINILQASLLAMKRAIEALSLRPHEVLVDGLYCPNTGIASRAIVEGDSIDPIFAATVDATEEAVLNALFMATTTDGRHGRTMEAIPLDRVRDWNRIYGPRGLQQFQCVVPERNAEAATRELLRCIATSSNASFLAVLKKCGGLASPGLLSFPMAGTSLALDFAHSDSLNEATFPRLDAIVRAAGGRLYPAKDAHMSAQDFRSFYPDWARVEALRDPALASRFWDRVTRT